MIKAVIFDCDGVLVDSEVLSIRGERAALAELGLTYSTDEFVARFVGLHDQAFFDALAEDHKTRLGVAPPTDFEARILAGRRRLSHLLTAVPGAADAVKATRRAVDGSVAVASSSRAEYLEKKLLRTSLHDLVAPHIYSADLVPNGKPAPDIFLYAADRLGVEPSNCLALEDSRNGVAAAAAAGMTAWGFTAGGHCDAAYGARLAEVGAARVCDSFADFTNQLGEVIG